ncbi:hypothetical protein PG996_009044 [Apiospora saccharicola]|uniref:Uncharacterized protein n=1 Tax=Apiospora saccharicola TaxID=335842 RepID=A0ABR1UJL7_9PEZI
MFSSSVLLASLAGLAASLPNDLSARVTRVVAAAGNPFAEFCTLDTCLQGVVGAALPVPSKALEDCSAFLQRTSTVTASVTPVTVTVTQAPPGTATSFATAHSTTTTTTTVDVSATVFNTVQETDTVTQTLQVTETSVATSFVTVTGLEVVVTTFTETSASVETEVATSVQTIAPQKRRNVLQGPKIKGRCKHPQGSASSSMSVSASASSLLPVVSTSSMSSLYSTSSLPMASTSSMSSPASTTSSATSGALGMRRRRSVRLGLHMRLRGPTVVTVTQTQEAVPATVTATIVVVTETVVNTDVSTATEPHSTTEVATETAFVSATVERTNVLSTTTARTVSATDFSTEVVTTTLVVPTTTTTTTLQTVTGTSCPAVPLTCAQPNFRVQIANGTNAGKYLGGYLDGFLIPFAYISVLDEGNPFIHTFTIDSDGTLSRVFRPDEPQSLFGGTPFPKIVFDPTPENEHAVYEVSDTITFGQALRPLQIQRGCGPACPTIQAQGPLRPAPSGSNGAPNTFGICNGVLSFDVNGVNTRCTLPGSRDVFEPFVGLKYIAV